MVVASKKFTRKRKEARNLYEEYLSSESEGYSTNSSGKEKRNTERILWYENQREIIMKHNQDCEMGRDSEIRDMSCRKCFSIREKISSNSDFLEFWEWYRKIMNAEMFTGETVRIFNKLKAVRFRDKTDINEENSAELTLLVLSMRYSKKPKYDIWEISLKIVKILSVNREFGIGIKKAIEKIGNGEVISEESTKIISDENNLNNEIKEEGSSEPKEEIHEME